MFLDEVGELPLIQQTRMELVIHRKTGQLLMAYTVPADNWIKPINPRNNPEDLAAGDGWQFSSLKNNKLNATVLEMISELWRSSGIEPGQYGQILLRPRQVASDLPAVEKQGKLIPLRSPGPGWIIQATGVNALYFGQADDRGRPPYATHCIQLIVLFVNG